MLLLKFSGKDKFNNPISGTIEAKSFDEAQKALIAEGYHFISFALMESIQPTNKTFYFEAKNRFNNKVSGEIESVDLGTAYNDLTNDLYTEIVISENPFTTSTLFSSNNEFDSNDTSFHDPTDIQQSNFNYNNSIPNIKAETLNPYSEDTPNRNGFSFGAVKDRKGFTNCENVPLINNVSKRSTGFWLVIGFLTKAIAFNVLFIKLAIELNRARSNYDQRYTYTALPIIGIFMDIFLMGLAKEPTPVEYWPSWIWVVLIIYVGVNIYWFQTFCDRIRDELYRRKIAFNYSSSYYWLLSFIPTVIVFIVGNGVEKTLVDSLIGNTNDMSTLMFLLIIIIVLLPIKYSFYYLTIKAMNLINEDYNSGRNNI